MVKGVGSEGAMASKCDALVVDERLMEQGTHKHTHPFTLRQR